MLSAAQRLRRSLSRTLLKADPGSGRVPVCSVALPLQVSAAPELTYHGEILRPGKTQIADRERTLP